MTKKMILVPMLAALAAAVVLVRPVQAADSDAHEREAHRRFRNGVELYRDGDARGALVEFKRAYELAANYKILYNLGQVAYELSDWAAARGYYRRYLDDGGAHVPAARKREVIEALEGLEKRVGRIAISSGPPGADLAIDDVVIGVTPVRNPIEVNVGRHRVSLQPKADPAQARWVEVVGSELVTVTFEIPVAAPVRPPAAPPVVPPARERRAEAVPAVSRVVAASGARRPQPEPVVRRSDARATPWLAWTTTAVLATGGAVAAIVASRETTALQADRDQFPADPVTLADEGKRARTWALVADGLFVGAAVAAVVSLVLTASGGESDRRAVRVSVSPTGASLQGAF